MDFGLEQSLRKVSRHEAGHSVVGRALGLRTYDIIVEFDPGGASGGSEVDLQMEVGSLDDLREHLRKRAIMLYAGCIAQSFDEKGHDETASDNCWKSNGSNDAAKAREVLRLWGNVSFGAAADYHDRLTAAEVQWRAEAVSLVVAHRADIERLVEALFAKADEDAMEIRMTGPEIATLLDATRPASTG